MNQFVQVLSNKQLLTTAAVASATFLLALPIGASVMPSASAASVDAPAVSGTVGCVDITGAVESASTTRTGQTSSTSTTTSNHTQTSSNNSGSTAQVGRDGIATAVTVGDVLSNNDVSVPVLSNNTTTVSPTVNLLNNASILSNNSGTLLDLDLLGL